VPHYLSLLQISDLLQLLSGVHRLGHGGQLVSRVNHRRALLRDDFQTGIALHGAHGLLRSKIISETAFDATGLFVDANHL